MMKTRLSYCLSFFYKPRDYIAYWKVEINFPDWIFHSFQRKQQEQLKIKNRRKFSRDLYLICCVTLHPSTCQSRAGKLRMIAQCDSYLLNTSFALLLMLTFIFHFWCLATNGGMGVRVARVEGVPRTLQSGGAGLPRRESQLSRNLRSYRKD
jgi:hypothetical protein